MRIVGLALFVVGAVIFVVTSIVHLIWGAKSKVVTVYLEDGRTDSKREYVLSDESMRLITNWEKLGSVLAIIGTFLMLYV